MTAPDELRIAREDLAATTAALQALVNACHRQSRPTANPAFEDAIRVLREAPAADPLLVGLPTMRAALESALPHLLQMADEAEEDQPNVRWPVRSVANQVAAAIEIGRRGKA